MLPQIPFRHTIFQYLPEITMVVFVVYLRHSNQSIKGCVCYVMLQWCSESFRLQVLITVPLSERACKSCKLFFLHSKMQYKSLLKIYLDVTASYDFIWMYILTAKFLCYCVFFLFYFANILFEDNVEGGLMAWRTWLFVFYALCFYTYVSELEGDFYIVMLIIIYFVQSFYFVVACRW